MAIHLLEGFGRLLSPIGRAVVSLAKKAGKPSDSPAGTVDATDISTSFIVGHLVGVAIAVVLMILHFAAGATHLIPNPIVSGLIGVVLSIAVMLFHKLGKWVAPDMFKFAQFEKANGLTPEEVQRPHSVGTAPDLPPEGDRPMPETARR